MRMDEPRDFASTEGICRYKSTSRCFNSSCFLFLKVQIKCEGRMKRFDGASLEIMRLG